MLMIHPASRLARDAGAALPPPALFAYGGCDDGATASTALTITAAGGTLDGPNGNIWPWRRNVLHQLGDGTNTQRNAPAQVPGINLH